jgi:uncharacterized repeat protein (TIGR04042 family)
MPELYFRVRWPDGQAQRCYSPSTVIEDYFAPGTTYPLADFLERSRQALRIASDRVRAKYGFACSSAADQLAEIEAVAAAYVSTSDAAVTVETITPVSGAPVDGAHVNGAPVDGAPVDGAHVSGAHVNGAAT